MKENMTDVELNQELQKLTDQLPFKQKLLVFELINRYAFANSVLKNFLSESRCGYLDVLSTLIPRNRDMSHLNKKH